MRYLLAFKSFVDVLASCTFSRCYTNLKMVYYLSQRRLPSTLKWRDKEGTGDEPVQSVE